MVEDFIMSCLWIILGFAYPAFQCFKALEKQRTDNDELRFWCQYWIIMALLTILERVADAIISWLPMYGDLKLAFVIYLWYPKTKGTGYIYEKLLRPFVTNHETDLEKKLPEWRAKAWDFAIYYWQNYSDLGQSSIFQLLEKPSKSSNKKSGKKGSSSPPPPPNETPTFYKPGKNMKHSQPSSSSSSATSSHRTTSETSKSNIVQVQLDAKTEYVKVIDDVPGSHSTKNKLFFPQLNLRPLKA